MSTSHTTAVTALREAAQALGAGRRADGADGVLEDAERPGVAEEVAVVLDALVELLRSIDDEASTTGQRGTDLDPVLTHLVSGSVLARSVLDRRSTEG